MSQIVFEGIDIEELASVLSAGVDCGGTVIEPFVDAEGGWPLRCCLQPSGAGDELAIIAWSPYRWNGPYRETGPIVVHVSGCPGTEQLTALPQDLNDRPMALRPYDAEHKIMYPLVEHFPPNSNLTARVIALFKNPDVVEVYAKNHVGGCFAFVARNTSAGQVVERATVS
jgi:Protein of unknown function (DUF1203)